VNRDPTAFNQGRARGGRPQKEPGGAQYLKMKNQCIPVKSGLFLLFLALLTSPAAALYDSNISVDGKGVQLCISADGFDRKTCALNQSLALDGTRDHILYVIPYSELAQNETLIGTMNYYVRAGFSMVAVGLTAAFLFLFAWLFYSMYRNMMDYSGIFGGRRK
jgi:hypothetical protein